MSTFPLIEDYRHRSCPLTKEWFEQAKEAIRHRETLAMLMQRQLLWKYDESDCQCIRAYGYDKHDPWNECRVCGRCIADEPMLSEKHDAYEDKPYCIECVLALQNCSIEDIAALFS